jgi:hypothetical protein
LPREQTWIVFSAALQQNMYFTGIDSAREVTRWNISFKEGGNEILRLLSLMSQQGM